MSKYQPRLPAKLPPLINALKFVFEVAQCILKILFHGGRGIGLRYTDFYDHV